MIIGVDLGNYAVKTSENLHFLSKVIDSETKEISYVRKYIFRGYIETLHLLDFLQICDIVQHMLI